MLKISQQYTHKHSSNILGTDSITSSSGYDIQLPVILYREKLNYPERLVKVAASQNSFPVSNRINGLEMISGLLEVTGKEDDYYNCNIGQGAYEFSSVIKDKTLKDLDLGGERTFVKQSHYNYPEEDFTIFPVTNEAFWADESIKEEWISEVESTQNFFDANNLPYEASSVTPAAVYAITPFPFVGYLLKQIFKFAKMHITRNDFDASDMLARKVMYLNQSICNIDRKTTVGGTPRDPTYTYHFYRVLDTWKMNDIVPDIEISDFLIWIQNNLNVCFNFKRNREVQIIDREAIFSKPASRFFMDKIIPESTEPDLEKDNNNGVSFIQEFDTDDNNFSEEKWESIDDIDSDLIDEPIELISDFLNLEGENKHLRYCLENRMWYRFYDHLIDSKADVRTSYTGSGWALFSSEIQNLYLGEKDFLEIKSGFSPTNINPSIDGNENSIKEQTEMKPRLFNHFGNEGGDHSWGSHEAHSDYESVGDGFIGENNLYEKRWVNTSRFFLKRTSCTCTANLTPQQLRDLDDTIPYLHPDGYTFLIDEVTASVSEGDEILECEIDLWAY